mgnify:CR=1 FL=1
MNRRPLSLSLKGATPAQAAIVARKEPPRTERQEKVEEPSSADAKLEPTKPENSESQPDPANESLSPKVETPAPASEKKPIKTPPPKKKKKARAARPPQIEEAYEPLVTQTFRLPRSIYERLQMISMSRKLKRLRPATQQDIVAEALNEWLEKMEED